MIDSRLLPESFFYFEQYVIYCITLPFNDVLVWIVQVNGSISFTPFCKEEKTDPSCKNENVSQLNQGRACKLFLCPSCHFEKP